MQFEVSFYPVLKKWIGYLWGCFEIVRIVNYKMQLSCCQKYQQLQTSSGVHVLKNLHQTFLGMSRYLRGFWLVTQRYFYLLGQKKKKKEEVNFSCDQNSALANKSILQFLDLEGYWSANFMQILHLILHPLILLAPRAL